MVTSEKWVEIMQAKEEEKNDKGTTARDRTKKEKTTDKKENKRQNKKENVDFLQNEPNININPAKVLNKNDKEAQYYCCAMAKSGMDHWKWPSRNDLLWYNAEDIVSTIMEPKLINNRGSYSVPEMQLYL